MKKEMLINSLIIYSGISLIWIVLSLLVHKFFLMEVVNRHVIFDIIKLSPVIIILYGIQYLLSFFE